jgi:hypothetical protein
MRAKFYGITIAGSKKHLFLQYFVNTVYIAGDTVIEAKYHINILENPVLFFYYFKNR